MRVEGTIPDYEYFDKSFEMCIADDLYLSVDYDDVDHPKVRALAIFIKAKLQGISLDESFVRIYKKILKERWDNDEYLREDYEEDFDSYIKECVGRGIGNESKG